MLDQQSIVTSLAAFNNTLLYMGQTSQTGLRELRSQALVTCVAGLCPFEQRPQKDVFLATLNSMAHGPFLCLQSLLFPAP